MSEEVVIIDGISVVLRRKAVKRMNLRVRAEGRVQLSIPFRLQTAAAEAFILEHRDWIRASQTKLQQLQQKHQQKLHHGETIAVLDQVYALVLEEKATKPQLSVHGQHIYLSLPDSNDIQTIEWLLDNWYKSQLHALIPSLLEKWSNKMQLPLPAWQVRKMSSRWGSCRPDKNRISLNLRLINYPSGCLEQVIVHELVHFFERRHNARFYAIMTHYMPDWMKYKKLLDR